MLRYRIEHPVVNDSQFAVWNSFGVQAWPSLVLIDPAGYAVWGHSGEVTFEQVDAVLRNAAPFYRQNGLLDNRPLRFDPEADKVAQDAVAVSGQDRGRRRRRAAVHRRQRPQPHRRRPAGRLAAGHHRLRRPWPEGWRLRAAEFNSPQGMALDGQTLYVADTVNHLIRKVDLAAKRVTTVAGTGTKPRHAADGPLAKPLATALSSPWDLLLHDGRLYIAMAGLHQIWVMRLDKPAISVYAGNGVEDIVDGPIEPRRLYQPGNASFAQPSGLASDGQWLYVADSEGSSIRGPVRREKRKCGPSSARPNSPRRGCSPSATSTDGATSVRLQHPLGLRSTRTGSTWPTRTTTRSKRSSRPRARRGRWREAPRRAGATTRQSSTLRRGIAAAAGKLYVADTDNHLIRVVDLGRGNRVSTLRISGLEGR